jgi:hypothetical protein
MKNSINYTALGQATDTTWGRQSSNQNGTQSIKFKVSQDRLTATFTVVISFASERDFFLVKRGYEQEAVDLIGQAVKKVKADYKEITNSSFKLKEVLSDDSLEIIGTNPYNPRKSALYRKTIQFEIS